jgi:hypothetical protein
MRRSLREIEESYWLELLVESGVVSVEKLTPCDKNGRAKAKRHRRQPEGRAIRERVNVKS